MPAYAIYVLALISGGLVLAYEVLWMRDLLNALGSTTRASAATLTAFMIGLAIGSWLGGRWTVRVKRPLALYAGAEGLLGLLGFAYPWIISRFGALNIADAIGGARASSMTVALEFGGLIAILMAPAVFMGIALPALAAALQELGASKTRHVAWLYGINTTGAAVGALVIGFGALPTFGLSASENGTAATSLVAAIIAAVFALKFGSTRERSVGEPNLRRRHQFSDPQNVNWTVIIIALFVGGVAALGYQVIWTRILVLVIGSSSNAFSLMLSLYLFGLALGGFWIGRRIDRSPNPLRAFQFLQLAVAASAMIGLLLLDFLPSAVLFGLANFGTSSTSVLLVGGAAAALVILPPTFFIGASLPLGARLIQGPILRRGRELGMVLAATTAGNVVGILATAFGIIPAIGLQSGVLALAVVNIAAAFIVWLQAPGATWSLRLPMPAAAFAAAIVFLFDPSWDSKVMTSGVFRRAPIYLALVGNTDRLKDVFAAYREVYYREGTEAVVAVFDRPTLSGKAHRFLVIDGKVDASTGADMATQILSGHIPFIYRPNARRALVIGLASGVTVGALLEHPLKRIDVVEIEPAVIQAARRFSSVNGAAMRDQRVRLMIDDGRRHLRSSVQRYDLIISEPSNPWLSMSARLFTREFFELARGKLTERGVFVQWVPLYGLSDLQFKALLRTLVSVFPHVSLFRVADGDMIAVASTRTMAVLPRGLRALFKDKSQIRNLRRAGIGSPADLLARLVADQHGFQSVLGEGILNTDDNGLLEFGSPWYVMADTRRANLNTIRLASARSKFAQSVIARLTAGVDGVSIVRRVVHRHLATKRLRLAGAYALSLRALGQLKEADILLGDIAAAQGRLTEAGAYWRRHQDMRSRIRLARLAYRRGLTDETIRRYGPIPASRRASHDTLNYALAIAAAGQNNKALVLLESIADEPLSVVGQIGLHTQIVLHARMGRSKRVATERVRLRKRLADLRRCLEIDGCRTIMDPLLRWSRAAPKGFSIDEWGKLRLELYLRVMRPIPHYLRGVRQLWLGEHAAAARSFTNYLALLPEADRRSRAHGMKKRAESLITSK